MLSSDLGVTQDQLFEIKRQARLELARRYAKQKDILRWGKALFPEKFTLPFCNELHGYFVRIRAEAFTDTEAPRNHSKTTIKCFLIPLFQALEEPEAFRHYLNVQATNDKALSVNRAIKTEIENSPDIRELYGDQMGERWTDQQFVLKNGVIFSALGAGQSIRGMNYRNIRPDYVIVDDLYDEEDINNVESTEKKNAWFWGSLYPARAKSRRCSMHVQGTAINNEDLLEQLKKQPDVISATFRAIKNWDTGEVLWPELNSFESLQGDRAKMGSVIFFREMQNERRDETTAIVKRSWLNAWEYDPADVYSRLRAGRNLFLAGVYVGNDPSIGKKVENDFTGTALVLKTQSKDGGGSEFWIEGLWNEKISLDKRIQQLEEIARGRPKEFPLTKVFVEAIAGFNDYADEVIRKTNLPVKRVDRVQDKISNLESKSHYFENGKVHLNKNIAQELKDTLVYQLTTNHPRHDDVRDGVLLCLDDSTPSWREFVG